MNEKSQHWYLLVIAADQHHVYVIDKLKYNTSVRKRDVDMMHIEFVQALVDMDDSVDLVDKYQIIWKQDRVINWHVVSPHYVPNQVEMDDGDNCGVYVIHFMQAPSEMPFITPHTICTTSHGLYLRVTPVFQALYCYNLSLLQITDLW